MRVVIVWLALSVVGCATSYQPSGFSGGFSETMLAPNMYRVSFRGNGFTSSDRVSDFVMLRAAELMQRSGYPYFVVVGSADQTSVSYSTTPAQSYTTVNAYGNTAYATTTTYGGYVTPIVKPGAGLTVAGLKSNTDGSAYEASFVIQSIRAKYDLR